MLIVELSPVRKKFVEYAVDISTANQITCRINRKDIKTIKALFTNPYTCIRCSASDLQNIVLFNDCFFQTLQ